MAEPELSPRAECLRVKNMLPRVWGAFYGRFFKPRPIQLKAAGPVLEGRSAVIASSTASGKTEAYLAPLTERWFDDMRKGLISIMIVCPTRALANDLVRRITPPLAKCRIKIVLRTGDHPNSIRGCSAGIVVTTLESLDSLLCRHASGLLGLKALVMEELHVAEGTPRGDQLSMLAERLDCLLHCQAAAEIPGTLAADHMPLQRLAVTATPGNSQLLCRKYLNGDAEILESSSEHEFSIYTEDLYGFKENLLSYINGGGRGREAGLFAKSERELSAMAVFMCCVKFCREHSCRKMLVFTGSRAEAEMLAASGRYLLDNPFGSFVFAHHSSLSVEQRENTEQSFAKADYAICFSTSTLEVGIDIGSIDAVALTEPPADVNSFMQRAGRGGRRGQRSSILCICNDSADRCFYRHLADSASRNELFTDHPPFLSSVLIQQSLSLVCQNPRHFIGAVSLHSRLPLFLRRLMSEKYCARILECAAGSGWLEPYGSGGKFIWSDKLQEAFLKGEMHHNISAVAGGGSGSSITVVEASSSRSIGVVNSIKRRSAETSGSDIEAGDFLRISGHTYRVLSSVKGHRVVVCRDEHSNPAREFFCEFAKSGAAAVSEGFASDFGRSLGFEADRSVWTQYAGRYVYSHFMGTAGAVLLREILSYCFGTMSFEVNAYVIKSDGLLPDMSGNLSREFLEMGIRSSRKKLAAELNLGPWSVCLSEDMISREIFRLAEHVRFFQHMKKFADPAAASDEQSEFLSLFQD